MKTLERIKGLIASVPEHVWADPEILSDVTSRLTALKADAVAQNNQELAKRIWCLEQGVYSQTKYLEAFQLLRDGEYYDAWRNLESVEIAQKGLARHCQSLADMPVMKFVFSAARRFQSLYPYRLFLSPALLEKKIECSICHQRVSIRNPCGHMPGEIYDGEMCHRIINEVQILEVSVVENPVQKYSVMFLSQGEEGHTDHYDYSVLEYPLQALSNPFHRWTFRKTKNRHPHRLFRHVGPTEPCPCESRLSYRECCLKHEGVLRPHIEFFFENAPPPNLPPIVYPHKAS